MITISTAEWDLRPKTKFIRVDGTIMGQSFDDTVEVERAIPQGTTGVILLLNATLVRSDGPLKPQPVPFYFADVTLGNEPWTHVQVTFGDETATMKITKII